MEDVTVNCFGAWDKLHTGTYIKIICTNRKREEDFTHYIGQQESNR